MAQLDRFLSVMVANGADAIHLAEREVATLQKDGVPRPITKQPLTAQQLLLLLREIAPVGAAEQLAAGVATEFHYTNGDGSFVVAASQVDGRWRASIGPGVPPDDAVAEAEAPAADPAVSAAPVVRGGPTTGAAPASANGAATAAPATNGIATNGARRNSRSAQVEDATPAPVTRAPISHHDARAAAQSTEERAASALADMDALLHILVEKKASDLHLRCGDSPLMRIDGQIVRLDEYPAIENDVMEAMLRAIMPGKSRQEFADTNDTDFAYELEGLARFRCNALRERRGAGGVFRVIPTEVVTVEQLGLPPEIQHLCYLNKGLVLVTGPTGSGKSTTLCALIDLVNRVRKDHVITIEDPIEFVHRNKQCMITQRQVGQHTLSFKSALRAALREDPDIILVGELRDLETVSIAIETAETGHLVFTTLHTTDAASTVSRIADSFPQERQHSVRAEMAMALAAMLTQTLIPRRNGGRVPAAELLMVGYGARQHIRKNALQHLHQEITITRKQGSFTLEESLAQLVFQNELLREEAMVRALHPEDLDVMLKGKGF